jgi:indolepyruvate decarboxylase
MPNVGQFLIERLKSVGARHAFGYPGDYVISFYDQLQNSDIELVTTTCERNAGIAADAYARINGIGVAVVTYCVGGFNIVDPTGCAFAEKSPVVIISGAPGLKEREDDLHPHHLVKEFECQHKIFSRITCANTVLRSPATAAYEIDRVLAACKYHKEPVYIEIPRDIVDKVISYDAWEQGTPPSNKSDPETLAEALQESVDWINRAERPMILAGVEVARFNFGKDLMKFAERLNIPIATTILGKSVVNERHPLSLGVFCGPLANDRCATLLNESDCVIMLGVEMTDVSMGFMPRKIIRRNAIISSCDETNVRSHSFRKVNFCDFFEKLSKSTYTRKAWQEVGEREIKKYVVDLNNKPLTTQRLFDKIDSIITDKMAIIADVGDSMFGSSGLTVNRNHFLSPAFYNSMGFAIPGSLGAQCADSTLRCLAIVGDGSFQQTNNELSTIVEKGFNPIVIVINNGGFLTERFFKDGSYNNIRNWNYHKMTEVIGGGEGMLVRTEGELDLAMKKAIASKELFIINAVVDKNDSSPALKKAVKGLVDKMRKI